MKTNKHSKRDQIQDTKLVDMNILEDQIIA